MKGDYRAMIGNINRRNILSNRGKCMVVKLDAEREARHLDYARKITEASITREEKEMRRKVEYLKDLMESNKVRKGKNRDSTTTGDNLRINKQPFAKQDQLDDSFRGDGVNFRRDHEKHHKRRTVDVLFGKPIGKLEATNIKRKINEQNRLLKALHEESRANSPRSGGYHQGSLSGIGLTTQVISLPEIKTEPRLQRKMSLSKLIASGEINNTLQGLSEHKFGKYETTPPSFLVSTKGPGQPGRTSKGRKSQAVPNRNDVKLPPNLAPVKYQKELLKHNPFITSDFAPTVSRSRALLDSKKSDEMYSWLGFGSKDQFDEKKLEEPQESRTVSFKRVMPVLRPLSDIRDIDETKSGIVDNKSVIKVEDRDDPTDSEVFANETGHDEVAHTANVDEEETEIVNDESVIKEDDAKDETDSKIPSKEVKTIEIEPKTDDEITKGNANEINTNSGNLPDNHKEHVRESSIEINVLKTRRPSFRKTDSKLSRESLRLGAPMVLLAPGEVTTTRQRKPSLKKFAAAARAVLIVRQFQMN